VSTAAERISRFVFDLKWDEIPAPVIAAARLHILDTIGCGLAARALGVGSEALSLVIEQGGRPESTAIGYETLLPAPSAALANGMLCHYLDYDDTHTGSGMHVSVTVLPAALAAAQAIGASGRELVAAVIAGSEAAIRIGMAAPLEFHRRGFHPTSVCGIFGATAAAGRLMGVGPEALTNALGLAGSLASGLFEYLGDGSATKPLHPGWAAHAGIQAVRLAMRGTTGPRTILEGRFGLYSAFVGNSDNGLEAQLSDLGTRWETPDIAFKPYPACHYSHASLDAVRILMNEKHLHADDVASVVAIVPRDAVALVLEPADSKVRPRTPYEAKFSLQFSIAALLLDGTVGVDTFTAQRIADPRLLEVAKRVSYEVSTYETYPAAFPGGARVSTVDGKVYTADLAHQRGSTGNPMRNEDIREKFRANASLALGGEGAHQLETELLTIGEGPDLGQVLVQLGRASVREPDALSPRGR
jgi:2-methylcitrate dehydratase PrpD